MKYVLKGNLVGVNCDEHFMPVSNTIIRLYKYAGDANSATALTAAQAKETFQRIDEKGIKDKEKYLLAETKTDKSGDYSFSIDGDKMKFQGGVVEFDVHYSKIPDYGQKDTKAPRKYKPFQVTLNVMQPKWKETNSGLEAGWNYRISNRLWCMILAWLDIWVICGVVLNCESQQPLPGIDVTAMDDDWITDDELGTATTDSSGRFCIYYRSKDFKKTFASPIINVETPLFPWGNGPDIYFKFAFGGSTIYEEPSSRARESDRENVGNCFCVRLCLKEREPGPRDEPVGYFFAIGQIRRYNSILNIDPTNGKTTGKLTAAWNNQAFYNNLALIGALTEKLNGQPMEYKFQYTEVNNPGDPVPGLGGWKDVIPSQIANTVIGYGWKWDPFPIYKYQDIALNADSSQIPVNFNGNWIIVPQSGSLPSGFNLVLNNNGPLIKLISTTIANTPVDMAGLVQGNSTTTINPLQKNRYFSLRMMKREAGNVASEVGSGVSRPLAIFNTRYLNVPQRGSWLPTTDSTELGVACVDLAELAASGGCSTISNSLTAKYTAANPNLGAVTLSMTGPGGPHSFAPVVFTTPGEEANGSSAYAGNVGLLPKCSYEVRVSAELNLTNGESQHDGIWDRVLFCK